MTGILAVALKAGQPAHPYATTLVTHPGIKADVSEDRQHTVACLAEFDRMELYAVGADGAVHGGAALAIENDINLGLCCSVFAAQSDGTTNFMRAVLAVARAHARNNNARYVAYTKTINRLKYELRYMEV